MPLRRAFVPRHDAGAQALTGELFAAAAVKIERVARTESTNTDLLERVRAWPAGEPFVPVLRVAEAQVAGRGRHGRTWHAEAGASLTCSLAWPLRQADPAGLSLAVGVAVAEALDGASPGPRIGLKWPNDLLLVDAGALDDDAAGRRGEASSDLGRKLGGILIETVPLGAARVAIIGIGINVLPVAAASARSGVAWWGEIAPGATVERALQAIATPLVEALGLFDRQGFAGFATRFAARDVLRGRGVTSASAAPARNPAGAPETGATAGSAASNRPRCGAPLQGMACGVSARGELIVRGAGGERLVGSGEVALVGVAAAGSGAAC